MKANKFVTKQIVLLVISVLLATALLVVGIIDFNLQWLKILICVVLAVVLCLIMYFKIFPKIQNDNKSNN